VSAVEAPPVAAARVVEAPIWPGGGAGVGAAGHHAAVLAVALVAAVASYEHMRALAAVAGEDWRSWLLPSRSTAWRWRRR
jgi:hypothetical protein